MNLWFIHSLLAVVAIAITMVLYKVPSSKGHDKFTYSFLSLSVAAIISFVVFYKYIHIDSSAILFGSLWGIGFSFVTMLQMELLKKLDTNAIFPITSISSHVLVVILGVTFFHDKISILQFSGIILTFIIVSFYNKVHKHITFGNGLFPIVTILVLISTTSKFIQKFGSIHTEIRNFIFWQLLFAAISAFVILLVVKRRELKQKIMLSKQIIWWSVALGIFNFVGTVEIVKALSIGPFSLVYTINSFYILITSVLAWKFFGEKLTKHKILFLLLAIFTIILIGLG